MIQNKSKKIMDIPYNKLVGLIMAFLCSHSLLAQEKVSKTISETYEMTNAGEVHIENKYGDVIVEAWDKNSIEINVDINVSHKKLENAENLLNRITPKIKTVNGFVTVSSEIAERSSSFFSRYFNKANPFDFDRSNVQIDYTIKMPANAELEVLNKFGDVIINGWQGRLKADIEHGDLWINNDINRVDVSVKYGKLRAKYIDYATITLKNGSLAMHKSKDLRLNSSGSDIKIEEILSLELYSNKDEITIDMAKTIHGDTRFSTFSLDQLDGEINLSLKITDFRVAKINNVDAVINLDQESSEISLNISDIAFTLDAALEEGLLRLPKSFNNINTKMVDKRRRIREITASYGADPKGEISIRGVKGVILLKEFQ